MKGKLLFTGLITLAILLSSCSRSIAVSTTNSTFSAPEAAKVEKNIHSVIDNFSRIEAKTIDNLTEEEKEAFSAVFADPENYLAKSFAAGNVEPETKIIKTENKDIDLRSPADNGISFSNPLHIDFIYKKSSDLNLNLIVKLDDKDISARIRKGPIDSQWVATIENLETGNHKLSFIPRDKPGNISETTFQYKTQKPLDRITALADATVKRFKVKNMAWDWGEALLLYSLARLDNYKNENRYQEFIESYYQYHLKKGLPDINWSDRCAPALAAFELYKKNNNPQYKDISEKVVAYLKNAKRTKAGGLNHLGTYILSNFYPESMWVDSLMMYNVFAANWGKYMSDTEMTDFAAEQPVKFAGVLQNKFTKLWKHAYMTKLKRNLPDSEVYWLRGNGWAMASIPETLSALPEGNSKRPELLKILNDTAGALLPYQSENGMWYTVLNRPGETYLESSGTALVSYGMLNGIKKGYLPGSYRAPAEKAFLTLLDRFEQKEDGISMPEISDNTMPYNFLGYSLIPRKNDLPYGLAAMILAGIAYDSQNIVQE
jgi:unsaturated rhamnogalacturonyl hydrolase